MKDEEIKRLLVAKYNKICILLPTYKIIPTNTYHCMMVFLAQLYKAGFKPSILMLDQTNVVVARNELCRHFIDTHKKEEFDLTIWMDSDHDFKFQDFVKLLHHYYSLEVDILSARYVTRDNTEPKICAYHINAKSEYTAIHPDSVGVSPVDGVGFGMIMMSPKVMVDMHEAYGLRQFEFVHLTDKGTEIISEDLTWCKRAKDLGYEIYVDNEVDIGHYGGVFDVGFMKYLRKV